jgi:hypothetical protein
MSKLKILLLIISLIPCDHIAMIGIQSAVPIFNIKTSADVHLNDILDGKSKINAVVWDFHGILGIADNDAKEKYAHQEFAKFGTSFDELKAKNPEIAKDTQKLILKGFLAIQKKALDENAQLKADFDKIPKGVSGETYSAVFRKHGYKEIAELSDGLSTLYKPRPGMDHIMQLLHSLNIEQYIGSNISPHIYEATKNYFEKTYGNTMLNMLKIGAVVDISSYGPVPASSISASQLSHNKKPSEQFFKTLKSTLGKDLLPLYIDDKESNINEAIKYGPIVAILLDSKDQQFTNNVEKLLLTLKLSIAKEK